MRKWLLNFIEITILVIISLGCILLITQSTILKNKAIFGYRSYVIASNSMYPVLEYGDVILVKEIEIEDIEVGDIITYQGIKGELKDKIITHEVIEIEKLDTGITLKTKGRANTGIDPSVYEEQVYGKYCYRFILLSFISKIVRNEVGFVLFIFIPFGILFVLEFINMVKETKRRELEKLVKKQLDELKKLNNNSKEVVSIENTICIQLEEIKQAKRDFKKIDALEHTVKISLDDIASEIEEIKKKEKKKKKKTVKKEANILLDETAVLFTSDDIRKEINKELQLQKKKAKKKKTK